jgi:ADP-ribose pyrophosphatase YjhB (NUDIX family)
MTITHEENPPHPIPATAVFIVREGAIFRALRRHFITHYFVVNLPCGVEPEVLEPKKCTEWRWFKLDEVPPPSELFCDIMPILRDFTEIGRVACVHHGDVSS